MVDDITEKSYNAFMINRSLSYFQDTVFFANEMNLQHINWSPLYYIILFFHLCSPFFLFLLFG